MADRYWVGGAGTWNTTSTTNWSASTGGASGASVPTVADNVIFDQAGTYTVTMTGALACLNITVSAGTVTFATGTSPTLNIRGSMSLLAGTVWSSTADITFSSTTTGQTITTNGVSLAGRLFFNGIGGYWTLGSALTSTNASDSGFGAGTFDTAGFALTCAGFNLSFASNNRTIKLNNSTVTLNGGIFLSGGSSTLTFDAGTSQINITTATSNISNNSVAPAITLNFYNFAFTSSAAGSRSISGVNTFNNFAVTGPAAVGTTTVSFVDQQTINGTLSTTGTAGNRRVFFASATYGISEDLVVNSAPSLTDADFRGLYVRGTSAPISGTRIGNRGECRGITFDAPKTVYWNLAGAQNWSANGWATTSTGTPSTDNFPLPQDTATFTNAGSVTGTITLDTAIGYVSNVDMSGRTTAMTISLANAITVYGSWANGSGTAFTGTNAFTFSGGTTQIITSAGVAFPNSIFINTYGGTVKLGDGFVSTAIFYLTNGTLDTDGKSFNVGALNFDVSGIKRALYLRNSSVTVGGIDSSGITPAGLTFDAGTSTINFTQNGPGVNLQYYDAVFTAPISVGFGYLYGSFRNLTVTTDGAAGVYYAYTTGNTISGTLSISSASAISRFLLRTNTLGTSATISAASVSTLSDVDFVDIAFTTSVSGTRLGDGGGNANITFPAPKTVYWNLAGAQSWYSAGWATSSGGAPAANNFPLLQDTAVFDNAGSVTGTITIPFYGHVGTINASARTTAMTLAISAGVDASIFGDLILGTGVTTSGSGSSLSFIGRTTQTITPNGRTIVWAPIIAKSTIPSLPVTQLGGALTVTASSGISISGNFDAVTYNVTTTSLSLSTGTLTMGSGTWTLSSTGNVWTYISGTILKGTANIVLSSTSTVGRTFNGGANSYNRLTIGGATGTSTTTILGNNTFTELASTKTVAHTIALGTTAQTFGAWTVTGTLGNVVTVSGTGTNHVIAGPRVSGVNYLAMGSIGFTTSPAEFYAGVNSTGTGSGVILTAAPAARTLYWRGGTGNWSDTTKWDTASGGPGPAAIPTSADAVIFNSASNATAYTATVSGVSIARCASFNIAGPATGNVTFAGSVPIAFHGDVTVAATGVTRTYTGTINLSGNASRTITTNAVTFASNITVNGIGSTWSLGSALNIGSSGLTVTNGSFDTSVSNYALTLGTISSANSNTRSITLNGSAVSVSGSSSSAIFISLINNLTFNAGSSQINLTSATTGIASGGLTFNNVAFTNSASATTIAITGANTFNTLSFVGRGTVGVNRATFSANQTISTLTLNAGTTAAYRTMLQSDAIGTTRTLAVTTLTAGAADYDFRDIAITGSAAPLSVTRAGDCKGNSGITFSAAKTVYYRQTGSADWGTASPGSWSLTSGGAFDDTAFPLPQDTAVFPATTYPASGSTTTIPNGYNIGTIDMSLRTTNTMTLATTTTTLTIYGDWINGTGITLSGTTNITFPGRGSQTITSAGRTFTQAFTIDTPGGSVTLQDNLVASQSLAGVLTLTKGTFDANTSNVTLSGAASSVNASGTGTRTIAIGSGTWSIAGTGGWNAATATNLSVTGTGTISLTSASAKTFAGGNASYSGITLDQGGAGALTITGNNTFKTISNTYSATGATSISLGNTRQTLTNPWTATGAATRVLTVSGTSAASPATLVYTGAGEAANTVDYLAINNVRAYDLTDEWYAGANSTNGGSLGWYFVAAGGTVYAATIIETGTGTDSVVAGLVYLGTVSELATSSDAFAAAASFRGSISETGTGADTISAQSAFGSAILESATIADTNLARLIALATITESATGTDAISALQALAAAVAETATITDSLSARAVFIGLLQEAATAQDSVNAAGSIYNILMQELATAQDAITANAAFQSSLAETATGTEVNNAAFIPLATISESATITDVASALQAFAASISETSAASDVVLVAPSIFNAIAVAAATAIDNFNPAGSIYNVTVPESATLSDSVIGAFLWNIIDDAQNVTWNLVDAAQPATWAHVEASQASDWNIIPITGVLGSTWSSSAAGGGTAILLNTSRSPDGYQFYAVNSYGVWTVQRFPIVGLFRAVSYLNNQYFVYSSPTITSGSVLLRSTDALTWTPVTTLPSSASQVTGMFANGSTIVAVYNGQTYVTTDNCATWTAGSAMPSALQGSIVGLNYGAGLYILCDGRRIFSSPDALTWTTRATITYSLGASGYRGTVAWDGSRFAVVARSSTASVAPAFRTSTNGTTWTTFTPPAPISSQAVAVLWDGAQFVFVCGGAGATPASFYSANSTLTTFTLLGSVPGFFYVPTSLAQYLFGKFGSQYVIPGFASPNNGPFYTSPNFSTFNAVIPPLPTDAWGNIATDQTQTWGIIPQQ